MILKGRQNALQETIPCTSVRGHETSIGEVIDPNKCCMCFVSYEDDILELGAWD